MSEMVRCPACQSILRTPPGAQMIRCPKCKQVLTMESPAEEPPPAVVAPPLAFAQKPATKKTHVPKEPKKKGGKSPYDHQASGTAAEKKEQEEKERRKAIKKMLEDYEAKEEAEKEEFEYLKDVCGKGRIAMNLLTWASRCYLFSFILLLIAMLGAAMAGITAVVTQQNELGILAALMLALVPLALVVAGLNCLLTIAAMVLAILGPDKGRHVAVVGLVVSVAHVCFCLAEFFTVPIVTDITKEGMGQIWATLSQNIYGRIGLTTNFFFLSEHPARVALGYYWSIWGVAAAAMEFSRLVTVCMLASHYATEGKEPESGYRAFQTINRIFWLILLMAMFRVAFAFGFDWVNRAEIWFIFGVGFHNILTLVGFIALPIYLLKLSQSLGDIAEIVDPRRFILKGERIEAL